MSSRFPSPYLSLLLDLSPVCDFSSPFVSHPTPVLLSKQSAAVTGYSVILQSGWTKYAPDYKLISDRVMVVGAMVSVPNSLSSLLRVISFLFPSCSLPPSYSHTSICSAKSQPSSITEALAPQPQDCVQGIQLSSVRSLVINTSGLRWSSELALVPADAPSLTSLWKS
jgi:hypothetical protein